MEQHRHLVGHSRHYSTIVANAAMKLPDLEGKRRVLEEQISLHTEVHCFETNRKGGTGWGEKV